jgi:molecular chaperone GrpE
VPKKKNPDINETSKEKDKEKDTPEKNAQAPENEKAEENKESAELQAVREELSNLKKEYDELKDIYLRTLAEYDNYRKRTLKEKDALYLDAKAEVLKNFLPVADNFQRALSASANEDLDSYKQGMGMIINQFLKALSDEGLTEFGNVGDSFDPNIHNCVMHEENEELGENVISEVFQKGYMLGDRVVRAAVVKVAN